MFWPGNTEKKVRRRIEKCLQEMVDIEYTELDDGNYQIIRGSAIIYLSIDNWGMNDVLVRCTAYVVIGAEIDADLMMFLLEANSKLTFGGFAVDEDHDILYEYALIASNATIYQLKEAIKSVAKAVDDYDNKIINRWGGETSYKVHFGVDAD